MVLVSYIVFGRLAVFITGTLLGIFLHSSWEAQRGRNYSGGGFSWGGQIGKGKEAEHSKVIHPSV